MGDINDNEINLQFQDNFNKFNVVLYNQFEDVEISDLSEVFDIIKKYGIYRSRIMNLFYSLLNRNGVSRILFYDAKNIGNKIKMENKSLNLDTSCNSDILKTISKLDIEDKNLLPCGENKSKCIKYLFAEELSFFKNNSPEFNINEDVEINLKYLPYVVLTIGDAYNISTQLYRDFLDRINEDKDNINGKDLGVIINMEPYYPDYVINDLLKYNIYIPDDDGSREFINDILILIPFYDNNITYNKIDENNKKGAFEDSNTIVIDLISMFEYGCNNFMVFEKYNDNNRFTTNERDNINRLIRNTLNNFISKDYRYIDDINVYRNIRTNIINFILKKYSTSGTFMNLEKIKNAAISWCIRYNNQLVDEYIDDKNFDYKKLFERRFPNTINTYPKLEKDYLLNLVVKSLSLEWPEIKIINIDQGLKSILDIFIKSNNRHISDIYKKIMEKCKKIYKNFDKYYIISEQYAKKNDYISSDTIKNLKYIRYLLVVDDIADKLIYLSHVSVNYETVRASALIDYAKKKLRKTKGIKLYYFVGEIISTLKIEYEINDGFFSKFKKALTLDMKKLLNNDIYKIIDMKFEIDKAKIEGKISEDLENLENDFKKTIEKI